MPYPLLVPASPWVDISMDLITGLPKVGGYDVVCMIVDRVSKEMVVIPIASTAMTQQLAALFHDHIWSKHSVPNSIISDCGLCCGSYTTPPSLPSQSSLYGCPLHL